MKAHCIVPALALAMMWGAQAFAGPPTYSYVTTGPGKQVLRVNNSTGAVTSLFTSNASSVDRLADLTLFSDENLYVGTLNGTNPSSSSILKLGTNDLYIADTPKELRFSAYGRLFCNGPGGVRRVVTPAGGCSDSVTAATGTAGSGLAFSANGSLIALVDGKLIKVALAADGQSIGSATTIATGLAAVKSIGVAAGGVNTATGFNPDDILVATASEIRRFVRDKTQTSGYQSASVSVVSAPSGSSINYMELDAQDRIWFTTMIVDGQSNNPNGKLWSYAGGSPTLVAAAPKQNGKYWPMVGLAIDPSDRTVLISNNKADFGSSWFEIFGTVNSDCKVTVRASTKFSDLPTLPSFYQLSPFLGDEGLSTVFDASVSPANCDVFPQNDGRVIISARQSSDTNPRMLKCETLSTCVVAPPLAHLHTGGLDDDAGDEGGTDSFSRWLVVNEIRPNAGYTYCGVQNPLKDGGDADHPQSAVNTGSNVAVKFRIGLGGCGSGQLLLAPNPQFLISVARVRPNYEAKHIPDSSGNSNEPPLFRFSGTQRSYIYDLSLKNLGGSNFEPGTYEITITDVNSPPYISTPPPIYISVTGKK